MIEGLQLMQIGREIFVQRNIRILRYNAGARVIRLDLIYVLNAVLRIIVVEDHHHAILEGYCRWLLLHNYLLAALDNLLLLSKGVLIYQFGHVAAHQLLLLLLHLLRHGSRVLHEVHRSGRRLMGDTEGVLLDLLGGARREA